MKKTNRTYGVYISHGYETRFVRGTKEEATKLFESIKYDFEYVALEKWSVRYNYWAKVCEFRNEHPRNETSYVGTF